MALVERGAAPPVPGLAARRAALRLLDAVLRQGLPLESALGRAASGLNPADRSLAHALAATVLRWLPDLDRLIDAETARPLPDDAKARAALRIALAGTLGLGTPPHAAIATVLPLVDGGPRRLVHGVFSAVLRRATGLPARPSLPAGVAARWQASWGADIVRAAEAAAAVPAPIDLSLIDAVAATDLLNAVRGATQIVPWQVRVPNGSAISTLPGFAEGAWWVQDLSASLAARVAGRGPGVALDLCAAPGGKTMALAAAGWSVTAIDLAQNRLERLRDNLARTHLSADLITADIERWTPQAPADLVLLDAPCSATGIFRRHPDVLHRVGAGAISALAATQARLIGRAAAWVKPGGMLVYAVCSLEPEEGEAIARAFVAQRSDFVVAPIGADEIGAAIQPTAEGTLRTLPGMVAEAGGLDGFFVARFRRAA